MRWSAVLAVAAVLAGGSRALVIGHSVERRPIGAIAIGPDSATRKILIVGCIHGNECAGLAITAARARR